MPALPVLPFKFGDSDSESELALRFFWFVGLPAGAGLDLSVDELERCLHIRNN